MVDVTGIKVEVDQKTGAVTLTGLDYQHLRSLVNAASLHRYNDPVVVSPLDGTMDDVTHDNNKQTVLWHMTERLVIDVLQTKLAHAINPEHSPDTTDRVRRMFELEVTQIDDTVRAAESAAAAAPKPPTNKIKEASDKMAEALRVAQAALATIRREAAQ